MRYGLLIAGELLGGLLIVGMAMFFTAAPLAALI